MFIDIHAHAVRRPFLQVDGRAPFPTPEQLIEFYDYNKIDKAVLMPIIGPEFYLPNSNEDILDAAARYPGRFIPFCNIHPRAINNTPEAPLSEVIMKYKAAGCKGFGEVTCNMPFRNPFIQNLLKHVELSGIPMTIHISPTIDGNYGLYDEPGLPQLAEALEKYPALKVFGHSQAFWAEIGTLDKAEDRAGYPNYPVRAEGAVPKLMRRFPNLYGDLSAGSGCNALTRDPEYAVKFINEFQDRLMFGLDICSPPKMEVPRLLQFLNELKDSGKISQLVFNKVMSENAVRLLEL
jgi:predicted TIM-barrel fold metal-dependent hydrolase